MQQPPPRTPLDSAIALNIIEPSAHSMETPDMCTGLLVVLMCWAFLVSGQLHSAVQQWERNCKKWNPNFQNNMINSLFTSHFWGICTINYSWPQTQERNPAVFCFFGFFYLAASLWAFTKKHTKTQKKNSNNKKTTLLSACNYLTSNYSVFSNDFTTSPFLKELFAVL